mmetsp:Transcript_25716/g.75382  ORF Transcript_25716/g.75382 Transcript_25716/m.75382 type:complete len:224 (-) Transcript_25716:481-1152(-)
MGARVAARWIWAWGASRRTARRTDSGASAAARVDARRQRVRKRRAASSVLPPPSSIFRSRRARWLRSSWARAPARAHMAAWRRADSVAVAGWVARRARIGTMPQAPRRARQEAAAVGSAAEGCVCGASGMGPSTRALRARHTHACAVDVCAGASLPSPAMSSSGLRRSTQPVSAKRRWLDGLPRSSVAVRPSASSTITDPPPSTSSPMMSSSRSKAPWKATIF